MGSVFKFKQFEVDQTGCAMKINTDGVLLAALLKAEAPRSILDIGTGTGVLALMMAQRFKHAHITAIEIDKSASITALQNFKHSVFRERLEMVNLPVENYRTDKLFDLTLSNPPFFVNDLKNTELKKSIARHADNLFFEMLLEKISTLLTAEGSFWFVLPVRQAELFIENASAKGFVAKTKISVHSDEGKPAFRWIVELSRLASATATDHIFIYQSEKVYTERYKQLLKPFFLNY